MIRCAASTAGVIPRKVRRPSSVICNSRARLSRLLEWVFGIKASTQLADPKLEALRRIAVLSWRRGYSVPSAEVRAFLASGYSPAEYELVVDGIAAAREAEAHRRA